MRWEALPILTAIIPIAWTWWRNRQSALVHPLSWSILAWAAWTVEAFVQSASTRFLAVALAACAGVSILGARRPGAAAWNAVVAGLLAVLLLPIGRHWLLGETAPFDSVWLWFVGALVAFGCLNYFFTRMRWPAIAALIICLLQIGYIRRGPSPKDEGVVEFLGGFIPWFAGITFYRYTATAPDFLELWRGFRDRFGTVWGLRVMMQFNAAANNAKQKFDLKWEALVSDTDKPLTDRETEEARRLLHSLTQRFGWP